MDMKTYFLDSDNFEKIINSKIKNVQSFKQIQTGWTNFVFDVKTNLHDYIVRFPRNDFFSNALVKEYNVLQDIKDKISFITPSLTLYYDNNRPYTIHEKINGKSLSECYSSLTIKDKKNLANDICLLIKGFKEINTENSNLILVSQFLDNLSQVSQNGYDKTIHDYMRKLEKENLIFSHGDFNPGNLILKDNKFVAIIDFSFSGLSHPYTDLSRIIGRCPSDFKALLLNEYNKTFKTEVDENEIAKLIKIWDYVEEKYILYIKQYHPSIKLPDLI